MRYMNFIEDASGDLVDLEIYCSAECWRDAGLGDPFGYAWPAPEPADYTQHCPNCGLVVVVGYSDPQPSFDGWPA
jgi:hypothetical protein